jgi:obg-like ATPase 1
MGLVGLPNVGKSSTFNVLSNLSVPAENYPFCTKEPSEARVWVPDKRFDKLVESYEPKNKVAAQITVYDIAGLVSGASEGAGLGNAFLSHIMRTDGIFHVVRAFPDADIIHEEGDVNPERDMDIIHGEMIAKDMQMLTKKIEEVDTLIKRKTSKELKEESEILAKIKGYLEKAINVRDGEWSTKEIEYLNTNIYFTSKPVIYLVNIGRDQYIKKQNKWLPKIQEWIKAHGGGPMLPYSAAFEKEIVDTCMEDLSVANRLKVAEEMGAPSMINKIIGCGYKTLRLIHYFTAGKDEVKCWTIREGWKAPQAAGVIHGDFERGFICAEIMKYDDWAEQGGEQECKANGKYRQEGKAYEVVDGDIIYFKFNVTASKGKIDKGAGK